MKVRRALVLSLLASAILAACGGGGGGGGSPAGGGSISGKVIDGYIQGATVCLDLNQNNNCDAGEPSTTTSASGSYTLNYGSDAVIENIPVVVNVPVGAIDQSDGPISKAYKLAAPANNALVISPFSTLALYKIKFTPGMTYAQAAQAVADKLMATGAQFDPTQDFIGANNTAVQNAARATVALLQSSNLNTNPTQTNLDAFLTLAESPAKFGYANPGATFKRIQQEVSQVLQSALTVSSLTLSGTTFATAPTALASDKSGNLYAADGTQILKVNQSSGTAAVLASGFTAPGGLALDASGNLYVTDQNTIFKITPTGEKSTYAGSSTAGSADGSLSAARFNSPTGLSISADGTMYVADTSNDAIREINMTAGTVSTLDLSAFNTAAYTAANNPKFVASTSSGLYYAGSNGIFRWDGTRVTGYTFSAPTFVGGLTSSSSGDVYFTDSLRAKTFKFLENSVQVSFASPYITAQIAGTSTSGSTDGSAATAKFAFPLTGIAVGNDGAIYVSDSGNRKIRAIR